MQEFEGKETDVIAVISSTGEESTEYYDRATHLHIGMRHRVSTAAGDVPMTMVLSDYQTFDGVLLPASIKQLLPGGQVMLARVRSVRHALQADTVAIVPPAAVRLLLGTPRP